MTTSFDLPAEYQPDPPRLYGSRDPQTGQTYFPPRPLSVDGKLRPLETVPLASEGVLWSFASLAGVLYGQVDLPGDIRILAKLAPGDYSIGDRCVLEAAAIEGAVTPKWRFARA